MIKLIILIFSLFFTSILSQSCTGNPLQSLYGIEGLQSPAMASNVNFCKSLNNTQACCSVTTLNGFQSKADAVISSMIQEAGAKDAFLLRARGVVMKLTTQMRTFQTVVADAIPFLDSQIAAGGVNGALALEVRTISTEFSEAAKIFTDEFSELQASFITYQNARRTCIHEMVNVQAAGWCLACDPNFSTKGVNAKGELVMSDDLKQRILDGCYNYLEQSKKQNQILKLYYATSLFVSLVSPLEQMAQGNSQGLTSFFTVSNAFRGRRLPPNANELPTSFPSSCTSTSCDWMFKTLFVDGQVETSNLVSGGKVSYSTWSLTIINEDYEEDETDEERGEEDGPEEKDGEEQDPEEDPEEEDIIENNPEEEDSKEENPEGNPEEGSEEDEPEEENPEEEEEDAENPEEQDPEDSPGESSEEDNPEEENPEEQDPEDNPGEGSEEDNPEEEENPEGSPEEGSEEDEPEEENPEEEGDAENPEEQNPEDNPGESSEEDNPEEEDSEEENPEGSPEEGSEEDEPEEENPEEEEGNAENPEEQDPEDNPGEGSEEDNPEEEDSEEENPEGNPEEGSEEDEPEEENPEEEEGDTENPEEQNPEDNPEEGSEEDEPEEENPEEEGDEENSEEEDPEEDPEEDVEEDNPEEEDSEDNLGNGSEEDEPGEVNPEDNLEEEFEPGRILYRKFLILRKLQTGTWNPDRDEAGVVLNFPQNPGSVDNNDLNFINYNSASRNSIIASLLTLVLILLY